MRNWAGNLEYHARRLHEPVSIEQVQEIVALRCACAIRGTSPVACTPQLGVVGPWHRRRNAFVDRFLP